MNAPSGFVDIHCHLLPGIDDGPREWDGSIAMAKALVAQGMSTVVVTTHQLGIYPKTHGDTIRGLAAQLQERLEAEEIPLRVLPGAELLMEPTFIARIESGQLLTLADHRRHVLFEMPEAIFLPPDRLLAEFEAAGIVGILAHPERNLGAFERPELVYELVENGCLLQVTAASLTGLFGPRVRSFVELLVREGLVHFVSTDAHGPGPRCSTLRAAYHRVAMLAGEDRARELFCVNPGRVAAGRDVAPGARKPVQSRWSRWLSWRKAG